MAQKSHRCVCILLGNRKGCTFSIVCIFSIVNCVHFLTLCQFGNCNSTRLLLFSVPSLVTGQNDNNEV